MTWTKAEGPVSYYLVSYGLNSKASDFGNPNIGGMQTTTYKVRGLSGNTTYYFRVRAGNDCTPGEFSNILPSRANGFRTFKIAQGFKVGVQGISKNTSNNGKFVGIQLAPKVDIENPKPNKNILISISSFFSKFFK